MVGIDTRYLRHRVRRLVNYNPYRNSEEHAFLKEVAGVVHVGANTGQERFKYDFFDLDVLWVEPIPHIFETLRRNISRFPRQKAFNRLITDTTGRTYDFKVASNDGASSSILDLKDHKLLFPQVDYVDVLKLTGITLADFLDKEAPPLKGAQALSLDTQGSELLVLKGAGAKLDRFTFIKTEVADFQSYAGCTTLSELVEFLAEKGFRKIAEAKFAHAMNVGSYYDVLFRKP